MTDRRRKGSLAWYDNSSKDLRAIIPVDAKNSGLYAAKIGMTTEKINDFLVPVTLLELIPGEFKEGCWTWYASKLSSKSVRRKDFVREIRSSQTEYENLKEEVLKSSKFDVIGLSKGKGTCGPIKRRKIKAQKRKARGGVVRHPGSMGLRQMARIPYTKPFAGKHGFSRRTLFGLTNLGTINMKNQSFLRYYVKQGCVLGVKGSVTGPIGRIVKIRPTTR